jgi:hypothetical protein
MSTRVSPYQIDLIHKYLIAVCNFDIMTTNDWIDLVVTTDITSSTVERAGK